LLFHDSTMRACVIFDPDVFTSCKSSITRRRWARFPDIKSAEFIFHLASDVHLSAHVQTHCILTSCPNTTMSQIPHLLSSYLALPSETSLILLTSVLGASTNWLLLRYLQSFLRPSSPDGNGNGDAQKEKVKVLLLSFMRDWAFWKDGGRKLVSWHARERHGEKEGNGLETVADVGLQGLDLDKLAAKKRFAFLDGLSGLFVTPMKTWTSEENGNILHSNNLATIHRSIKTAIKSLQGEGGKVVLVIDHIDFLLAVSGDETTPVALGDMLMDLRQVSDGHLAGYMKLLYWGANSTKGCSRNNCDTCGW